MKLKKIDTGFTQVPNCLLYSQNISLKAKGLFCYMQAKPNEWEFSYIRIAKENKEGESAILSGMKELEMNGYLKRNKFKNEKGQWDWEHELIIPSKENPYLENPYVENPSMDNLSTNKEIIKNKYKEINREHISATQRESSTPFVSASKTATNEEFEAFWKTYPRKVNKLAAKKAYEKAIKGDKKKDNPPVSALDILSGLQKQLKFKTFSPEMKYIPHPATWLNSGAFYNEIDEQEMAEKTDELPIYPIWKIIKDDAKLRGWWQDCQDNEETYKNEPNPDCRFPAIPMFNSWLKKEGYQFRAKLI